MHVPQPEEATEVVDVSKIDTRRIAQLFVRLTFRERSIAAALEKPETLSVKMLETHARVNSAAALLRAEIELETESKGFVPPPLWLAWFEHVHRETVARLKREIADLPTAEEAKGRPATDWTGCIYISYASEDERIAEIVAAQLQEAGLVVWFDRFALEPGQSWASASRAALLQAGAFISLISVNSAKRETGHFVEERQFAADRLEREGNSRFYFPVRIDEGKPIIPPTEPKIVQAVHAVRAPGGRLDRKLILILQEIQKHFRPGTGSTPPVP